MGTIRKVLSQLSITKKVALIVSLSLFLALNIMVIILLNNQSSSNIELTGQNVHNLSQIIIKSVKNSMSQGTSNIKPYIQQLREIHDLLELRVIPTDKIKSGSENKMDGDEQKVALYQKPKMLTEEFNGEPVLRNIEPLVSDEHCTSCHSNSNGEALAVVSIRYSLAEMNSVIASQRLMAILLSVATIIVTFFISMFFIKQQVVKDLNKAVHDIHKFSDGDLIEVNFVDRKDEIGKLNQSLKKLQTNMKRRAEIGSNLAAGNLSDEIVLLSEKDLLGISFQTLKSSLKNLVSDANSIIHAAIAGNLKYRVDVSRHKGEFEELIKGINSILDEATRPVIESNLVLRKMAEGDLTVRMTGEYKGDYSIIKDSINHVGEAFNGAMNEVSSAVQATASAGNQISASSEEMAAGSQEQSNQTSEVASAVEEMSKTILETTRNVSNASDSAKRAGLIAKEGGKVVSETIEGMNRVANVVKKSAETVHALGKNSNQIGEIVQVINDIADQTNLLALNAAIEAARAGEQGRGFAVVADEVRKLAERTTKATKEIATMIKQIQKDTDEAVVSMKLGTQEVEKGKDLSDKAGQSLKEIISGSQQVVDMISQVAAASEEQSSAAEQISKNIDGINNIARENSVGIHQIAKASEDLSRLTINLQELISRFKFAHDETNSIEAERKVGLNKSYSVNGKLAVRSNGKLVPR